MACLWDVRKTKTTLWRTYRPDPSVDYFDTESTCYRLWVVSVVPMPKTYSSHKKDRVTINHSLEKAYQVPGSTYIMSSPTGPVA